MSQNFSCLVTFPVLRNSKHLLTDYQTMTSTCDAEIQAVIQFFEGEIWAVVRFCEDLGKTLTKTYRLLQESGCKCSWLLVFKWHGRFRDGKESIADDKPRWYSPSVWSKMVEQAKTRINENRRLTVRMMAKEQYVSKDMVHRMLSEDLNMSTVSVRWIPKLLSEEHKSWQVTSSCELLTQYEKEGDNFLDQIITTDKTWRRHYWPESKQQSCVWKTLNTPSPPTRKVMLLIHEVPEGGTV